MLRNTRPEPIIASEPISGVAVMRNVPTLLTGITVPE